MTCKHCNEPMVPGVAFQNVPSGTGDFSANDEAVTLSYGEKAKLIKCPKCGYSVGSGVDAVNNRTEVAK